MDKQSTVIRIRKDLNSLSQDQLKYYQLLYKLLRIFGPEENQIKVEDFQFSVSISTDPTIPSIKITPSCYYDILISYHCTCCQHANQFFPYWHRWLTNQFQNFLQAVDQKISQFNQQKMKGQAQRLHKIAMNNTISPIPTAECILQSLIQIKSIYDNIPQQARSNIAAHYWNVFNYSSTINYARGFTKKTPGLEALDLLITNIWGQDGLLQFNFKTRWYGDKIKTAVDEKTGFIITNNFQPNPTDNQIQQLIKDKLFWQNPDNENNTNQSILADQFQFMFSDNSGQYNYFYNKSNKIQRNTLLNNYKITHNVYEDDDINVLFGGQGKKYYDTTDSNSLGYMRNQYVPYYQYAKALKTDPIDFMRFFCTTSTNHQTSMENPHNFMHNNQSSMMNDASYSITNPIFFAYHSFIDLMLEIKIQWINAGLRFWQQKPLPHPQDIQDGYKSVQYFMNSLFKSKGLRRDFQAQWEKYLQKNNPNLKVYNKDYPIMTYVNPDWRNATDISTQFIPAKLTYSELIIDQNHLKDLKTIFKVVYDVDYTNKQDKLMKQLINVTKIIPDSPEKLSVNVQLKYKSTIKSGNNLIALRDSSKNLIDYVPVGIFSKGLGAVTCPKCPKFHVHNISIPIRNTKIRESFISKISSTKAIKSNRSEVTIYPQFNAHSNLYAQTKNSQISLRIKTGRRVVNVILSNKNCQKTQVCLSFIGQFQDFNDPNLKVTSFKTQYIDYDVQPSKQVYVRYESQQGQIVTQIDGNLICEGLTNIPFKYRFPLHSDVADLKIDLDALSNIKKETTQDERTKCFTETPKGFFHPSKFESLSNIKINDFVKELKKFTD